MWRLALLAVMLVAGCGGAGAMERLTLDSKLHDRPREHGVYDPREAGRPRRVLLHGRGSGPEDIRTRGLRGGRWGVLANRPVPL